MAPAPPTNAVRGRGVVIGGDLSLTGATLNSPGTADNPNRGALDLAGARVNGSVFAGEGAEGTMRPCHVAGTIRAVGATIGHRLDLSGAQQNGPRSEAEGRVRAGRSVVPTNVGRCQSGWGTARSRSHSHKQSQPRPFGGLL